MAARQLPEMCLGFPVDHRLKPLLGTELTASDASIGPGGHARAIESFGRTLQQYREDISEDEVKFAKWLAMPETKGGVVIVLLQPAEHQRYSPDHHQTVRDCNTLNAVDEVCKAVTGYGLEKISCFDVFPFHKIPVKKSLDDYAYEYELDEAYATFLDMIKMKQPDVVFCCYRIPGSTKYSDFECIGIGRTRHDQVTVQGQSYTCVNGFHPSYALNYLGDKSALRSLFLLEATQAFRRANGTWSERSWMTDVRENCAAITQIYRTVQPDQRDWTQHDFQRERFQSYMEQLKSVLNSLRSGAYDGMDNEDLYDFVLGRRFNVIFHDPLLVLVKIINFEDRGAGLLQDKGFAQLRQREERDIRDLRRNVERYCSDFLRSLRANRAPFQVERRGRGLFTHTGLNQSLLGLGPAPHLSGLHYGLRSSFLKLVQGLNGAHTYQGRDVYTTDRDELAQAFRFAAIDLESALAQHVASTLRRVPEEDLAISSRFSSLTIDFGPRQTENRTRTRSSQPRTTPVPSSAYPQSPPLTPSRRPSGSNDTPLSRAAVQSSPLVASHFGHMSPTRSPQAASSSQYRREPACKICKQRGHYSPSCPETQCYRCKGFGHMSFDCSGYPATPQRRS